MKGLEEVIDNTMNIVIISNWLSILTKLKTTDILEFNVVLLTRPINTFAKLINKVEQINTWNQSQSNQASTL